MGASGSLGFRFVKTGVRGRDEGQVSDLLEIPLEWVVTDERQEKKTSSLLVNTEDELDFLRWSQASVKNKGRWSAGCQGTGCGVLSF